MIDSKYTKLAGILKLIEAERKKILKLNTKSTPEMPQKAMQRLQESALVCGVEIKRLAHEAHCIAVEIGIADRRTPEHYTPTTASLGFGRKFKIERRPPVEAKQMKSERAAEVLELFNRWRRGAEIPMCDPKELGEAIDIAVLELSNHGSDE